MTFNARRPFWQDDPDDPEEPDDPGMPPEPAGIRILIAAACAGAAMAAGKLVEWAIDEIKARVRPEEEQDE